MRVLILDGHSAAGLESAQALGRGGAEVELACEYDDCLAFASRYLTRRLAQPGSVRADEALDWLRRTCAERRYDLVIPSTDISLDLIRGLDEHEPARQKAVLPDNGALDVAIDKLATHRLAQQLGIPVPSAVTIDQGGPVPDCSRFPVVLKSSRSRVVINGEKPRLETAIARNAVERNRILEAWLPHTAVQQQEFVAGRGYGIEMLFDHGRPVWHFAHERLHEVPLTGGGSSYRRSIAAPPDLLQHAERLLRELQWHGVAMVEFRGRDSRYYLMEINPRLWGSLALAIDCGVDFTAGLAALASGAPVGPQPSYRVGYYCRELLSDVQWQKLNLRADHRDPMLLTGPRLRSALELFRPLWGRESWDFFDWNDLAVTTRRLREILAQEKHRAALRATNWRLRRRSLLHHQQVKSGIARQGRPGRLLFLCHGNICRSPLAALLAARELAGARVRSAGFHMSEGRAIPDHVRHAAAGTGLDLRVHRSRRVTAREVAESDFILCMDVENLERLRSEFPDAYRRSTLLGLFAEEMPIDIPDPIDFSTDQTKDVVALVQDAVLGLRAWLEDLSVEDRAAGPPSMPTALSSTPDTRASRDTGFRKALQTVFCVTRCH